MKIVQINATCGNGSTGNICLQISKLLNESDIENYILYCSGNSKYSHGIKYANQGLIKLASLESRLLGNWGFEGKEATKNMIRILERLKPNIVHLHNIHNHACDLDMLFKWIKCNNVKLIWTFHDCWAYTGYCMHYDMSNCDKWKTKCSNCKLKKYYSWFIDNSSQLYNRKKMLFSDFHFTIVTPSMWLKKEVNGSFLNTQNVRIINNGIDLNVFYPRSLSDIKYQFDDKYVLLGVSQIWDNKKGLDVFGVLSETLESKYQIILVGEVPRKFKMKYSSIIYYDSISNKDELAILYSLATVLINPTREDNFPTVNIESLACGTPVITFNTGGSPEIIDSMCGAVVDKNDIDSLVCEIKTISQNSSSFTKSCIDRAKQYDMKDRFKSYIELYKEIDNE